MPSMAIIPDNGVRLSCTPLTEPLEVTVVTTDQKAVAAEPNLTSFPSMLPICWLMPICVIAGLPFIS